MKKFAISLLFLATMFVFSAPTVYATGSNDHNPAGNNGVIKINNEETPDSIPNNHPHVGCTFKVDFYNFDKGNYNATVNFALQSPTVDGRKLTVASGNVRPFIGSDAAGGGTDLDASETYKLTFTGAPHAQQGYHVKVTVHAPGSKGSDKKHKVFWVEACEAKAPGQVLGDSNSNQTVAELPKTGASFGSVLLSGLAISGVGYFTHLWFTKRLARKTE